MSEMFFGASAFNQDISGWLVHNVKYMEDMFNGASAFDQDLGDWAVQSVTSNCPPAPAPRPTPARACPGSDTVDAAPRLSGVSAALLVLALAA